MTAKKELFYNEFADQWESKINNWETQKRIKIIFGQLLKNEDLKNKKFLEIGCGLGYFSETALKKNAKVTGVDIGDRLINITQKRVKKGKFIVASASKLPFRDETFDTILCTEVIEHVNDQNKAIKEMFRVLKFGGVLVITTPNRFYKPLFDLLSLIRIRPYHGNENWIYLGDLRSRFYQLGLVVELELYFNLYINYGLRFIKT